MRLGALLGAESCYECIEISGIVCGCYVAEAEEIEQRYIIQYVFVVQKPTVLYCICILQCKVFKCCSVQCLCTQFLCFFSFIFWTESSVSPCYCQTLQNLPVDRLRCEGFDETQLALLASQIPNPPKITAANNSRTELHQAMEPFHAEHYACMCWCKRKTWEVTKHNTLLLYFFHTFEHKHLCFLLLVFSKHYFR